MEYGQGDNGNFIKILRKKIELQKNNCKKISSTLSERHKSELLIIIKRRTSGVATLVH